ncbi:hypothetical protein [Hymenobacter terrenus]|uniref:hypothetical protein n=1 Tax=Hymenobacter terrenus TaxID=1629124 RepID=UPI0006192A3D|nr:hypothetical protein [Hymenobacter terrenus]
MATPQPSTPSPDRRNDDHNDLPNGSYAQNEAGSDTVPRDEAPGDYSAAEAREVAQGSDFDNRRRQGATGPDDEYGTVGRTSGMGRAGFNGDEDRGYDESGYRGGLGTSGGREDLSNRHFDTDRNPLRGGYGGGDYSQPENEELRQNIGMHSRNPTEEQRDTEENHG